MIGSADFDIPARPTPRVLGVDAERSTGYHVGGISPLGQKKRLPVALDAAVLSERTVFLNGGQRGV